MTVTGLAEVQARLDGSVDRVRRALADSTLRLAIEAQRKVMAEKLSGQVLHVRTGRLRRSMNVQPISEGARVGASTGTNVVYGRFWELGFDGVEQVRAHTRQVSSRNVVAKIEGKRRQIAKGVAFVKAHARRVHASPRPFLSVVLAEMRERAIAQMTADVKGAI